jgi:hypothetical protein
MCPRPLQHKREGTAGEAALDDAQCLNIDQCLVRCTPAMAAGVTTKLWELVDMVKVLEEWETRDAG